MNYSSAANIYRKEEITIAPHRTHSKDTKGRDANLFLPVDLRG